MAERLSYEDSCRELQALELIDADEIPPMPDQPPRCDDDEPLGVSFFRTSLSDVALEGLTLPRTFFGRSEIDSVSFRNTDLSESVANWNDFKDTDFSDTNLTNCDLRACIFERVKFNGACLRNADIRHCTFTDCDFAGAEVAGLKITKAGAARLGLSNEQLRDIAWQADQGEEPDGG